MDYGNSSSSGDSDATTIISPVNMDCASSSDISSVATEENVFNDLESADSDSDWDIEPLDVPVSEATVLDGLVDGHDYRDIIYGTIRNYVCGFLVRGQLALRNSSGKPTGMCLTSILWVESCIQETMSDPYLINWMNGWTFVRLDSTVRTFSIFIKLFILFVLLIRLFSFLF